MNGPVVTAIGDAVAVAWFTVAGGTPHVKVAFSTDGGRTFGAPIQVDSKTTFGRLGMVMPSADRVIVSSIERGDAGVELVVRDVTRDGRTGTPVVIAPSTPTGRAGSRDSRSPGRRLSRLDGVQPGAPPRVRAPRRCEHPMNRSSCDSVCPESC